MANIITAFVRLYCYGDWQQAHLSRKGMLKTLSGHFGRSYCVPAWSQRVNSRIIDMQAGFKWSPGSGVSRVWERFGERLEAIWVRYYDEGSDYDVIYCLDHSGQDRSWSNCWYGFDHVRIHWQAQAPPAIKERGEIWQWACQGSYRAANDRCSLLRHDPEYVWLRTPTTPARSNPCWKVVWGEEYRMPEELRALTPDISEYGAMVEFCWKGRLVQRWKRQEPPLGRITWHLHNLDGWDNCVNEDWPGWCEKWQP